MERVDGHAVPLRGAARAARRRAGARDRRAAWSTRSPPCTPSTRPRSASATSAAPRASSSGRSAAGSSSSTPRAAATCPASTSCTTGSPDPFPRSGDPAIVHGDFRLDNLLVDDATTRCRAVLDWEMATLGDPLTDVALLLVYQRLAAILTDGVAVADVSRAPGFLTGAELRSSGTPPPAAATSATARLPPRARLLQARGDPRGHPLPLHPGPDRRRGLRPPSARPSTRSSRPASTAVKES